LHANVKYCFLYLTRAKLTVNKESVILNAACGEIKNILQLLLLVSIMVISSAQGQEMYLHLFQFGFSPYIKASI